MLNGYTMIPATLKNTIMIIIRIYIISVTETQLIVNRLLFVIQLCYCTQLILLVYIVDEYEEIRYSTEVELKVF